MPKLIVNDTHIGVTRRSGTTPVSAAALGARNLLNFQNLIMAHTDKDIIHAGDILDAFEVPNADLSNLYVVLATWLSKSGKKFYAMRANHDWNPRAGKLSSWELLFNILEIQFPGQIVRVQDKLIHLYGNVYGLGHVANQDEFDMNLERAIELSDSVLIAHANYDNFHAQDAQHSLNISEDWAKQFVAKGNRLYCGHEHQKSTHLKGKVVMLGSQDATSIADCLGNSVKYAHILEDDGSLTPIQTMDVDKEFVRVDWQELSSVEDQMFVRVEGKAEQSQAAEVVTTIAKYRSKSQAYIITNAVKVEGVNSIEGFDGVSLEDIRKFDVREALLELFEPAERKVLEKCLED